jgi:hypothetical protein
MLRCLSPLPQGAAAVVTEPHGSRKGHGSSASFPRRGRSYEIRNTLLVE